MNLKRSIIEKIKDDFNTFVFNKNPKKYGNKSVLTQYLKKHIDIFNECNNLLNIIPEYEKAENILICIIDNIELTKCAYCKKIIKFSKRNNIHCSTKCSTLNPDTKNKLKNTYKAVYGTENIQLLSSIKNKKANTLLKNYRS